MRRPETKCTGEGGDDPPVMLPGIPVCLHGSDLLGGRTNCRHPAPPLKVLQCVTTKVNTSAILVLSCAVWEEEHSTPRVVFLPAHTWEFTGAPGVCIREEGEDCRRVLACYPYLPLLWKPVRSMYGVEAQGRDTFAGEPVIQLALNSPPTPGVCCVCMTVGGGGRVLSVQGRDTSTDGLWSNLL